MSLKSDQRLFQSGLFRDLYNTVKLQRTRVGRLRPYAFAGIYTIIPRKPSCSNGYQQSRAKRV